MLNKSIGFIGAGRITRIFLAGFKNAGLSFKEIVVSDPNHENLAMIKSSYPEINAVLNGNRSAAKCDIIFLATHPPTINAILDEIKLELNSNSTIISLAPKLAISSISERLDGFKRIVRAIPNACSMVNFGYNPMVFAKSFSMAERSEIMDIFIALGECPEVSEEKLEAFAVITAMGPTYLWFQLFELQEIAMKIGLNPNEAKKGVLAMAAGAVKLMSDPQLTPEEIMDLVPTKPLGKEEESIKNLLRANLISIFNKLKA
jgi:pyrroline-5-carboxylate reductase